MHYFDGLHLGAAAHVPRCEAWIDRCFTRLFAINFLAGGKVKWAEPNGRMLDLSAPALWWTWPGEHFAYGVPAGQTWDHYYCTFWGSRAQHMFDTGLIPGDRARAWTSVHDGDAVRWRFEQLIDEVNAGVDQTPHAVHRIEGLFLSVHEASRGARGPAQRSQMLDLAERISAAPVAAWDFHREAARLSLSYSHFCRCFRCEIGQPPYRYVLQCRLRAAAARLIESDDTLEAIASDIGYTDAFAFSNAFTNLFGLRPSRYRAEHHLEPDPACRLDSATM